MKLRRFLSAGLLIWLGLVPWPAAASADDFTFTSFTADYYLTKDASSVSQLRIHEHLVANFPETDQNHGILRALPQNYQGHPTHLRVQSVTGDNGQAINYSQSTSHQNLVLKIGNAANYVHGTQSYNIDYTQDNVTSSQSGYDGFFWDTNGDQWPQPFGQVTAKLHLASDLTATLQPGGTRCFTGPAGSTAADCTVQADPGNTVITYTASRPLEARETLTIESRYPAGTFAAYKASPGETAAHLAYVFFLLILPVPLAIAVMWRQWSKYGRDPKGRGVIIPEYLPPKDISVLSSNAILTESYQPKAISATLIDLAVRGYIKIYEVKHKHIIGSSTGYELELIKDGAGLRAEEQAVLGLVFSAMDPGASSRVDLDSLKNKLYAGAGNIGKDVANALVQTGYFRSNPTYAKAPYLGIGFALLIIGFISNFTLFMFIIAGAIVFLLAHFMPARTAAGVEQRDYLLGLKMFITVAEADRIKTLQSPKGGLTEKIDISDTKKLVKLYERLLPYAMLFGIEKEWAKQFAGLYDDPPGWYSGSSSFNAGYFAGSLASFNSAAGASFTAPSSSGGGGSAGGGGGGGGGGGW